MISQVILIRHAEVEAQWKTVCYGALDVPLSEQGIVASRQCADRLESSDQPTVIFHSGLARTETVARMIADRLCRGLLTVDERLRERNYGDWQGLTWDEAYASDPEHFHDLIDQPDTYRPPNGETTTEMQRRIVHWYNEVSSLLSSRRIIAVSHSGPIAALAGYLLGLPANQWQPWTIKNLESIQITQHSPGSVSVHRLDAPTFDC